MAIDRSFPAALQKAVRSLEIGGRSLLWEAPEWRQGSPPGEGMYKPNDQRLWALMYAIRSGMSVDELAQTALIEPCSSAPCSG